MDRWTRLASAPCSLLIIAILANALATNDFRHISYEDLRDTNLFHEEGVTTYSQLLFDVARQQVVVGARDNLYRLTLTSLTPLEHAYWPAPEDKANTCQNKGQSNEDCHNYIKVLLSNGKSLFTCGTYAFSPWCTWRKIENISNVTSEMSGIAMCPYSPRANVTALLARGPSGGLFAGAPTDFSGTDPAIYRTLATPNLRTHQYDSKWLNDPQFVGSFETEDHVYFLYRETAVEYINCGKKIYSRIARVCKNDRGGQILMKDVWTTFSKARLNCSLPGEFPFYYDEIQGAAYHPDEGIVYATFTTPINSIAGSAICAFNMSAITASFNGPFKHQENVAAAWERRPVAHHNRQRCSGPSSNSPAYQAMEDQRYQLMDDAVQSTTIEPLHTATLERFTHIAVDVTPTKLHIGVTVLYVATTTGQIKKISVLPRTQETCVVEIWEKMPSMPMSLQFLKDTQSLYVGMEIGVLRIPAVQCYRHRTRQSCLNAQEPYCGWNELLMKCAQAPKQNHLANHWHQEVTRCPVLTDPVDGGWSAWSSWSTCQHGGADQFGHGHGHGQQHSDSEENTDSCQCQTRECNNPPPQHGGAMCTGASVRVANCTVHGGWTTWSAWSACSQTCGFAMKSRRRTCTNPAPAFGGRVCVGHDHDDNICINLPPCPTPVQTAPPPQIGSWSSWGAWNSCSKACNGGIRMRKRTCESTSPGKRPVECPGCDFQFEECNTHPCTETRRLSGWTQWLAVNASASASTGSMGYVEKRFRFGCRAQTDDPSSVRVQLAKEEERYCRNDGSCSRGNSNVNGFAESTAESGWGEWSGWRPCDRPCGGGSQHRVRQCETPPCEGSGIQTRACNLHPCRTNSNQNNPAQGQWSCWTEWSECSVSCGVGVRTRTRECMGPESCEGPRLAREMCEMPSCESLVGWDTWSRWSPCDGDRQQHRKRQCLQLGHDSCLGPSRQTRDCLPDCSDNDVNALPSSVETAGVSVGAVVGGCIAGFLAGLMVTAVMCFLYLKKKKPRIPGSPHYISKQNSYVTVPLKEVNAKRQPSFSGSTNGTLRISKNNPNVNGLGSPKLYTKALDYESATLKRNSHGQQHIRIDPDQDKYY